MKKLSRFILILAGLLVLLLVLSAAAPASPAAKLSAALQSQTKGTTDASIDVLIETTSFDYDAIVAAIEAAGGQVNQTFKYAKGLAATVPVARMMDIAALSGVSGVSLDELQYPGPAAGGDILPAGGASLHDQKDLDAFAAAGTGYSIEGDFETLTLDGAELDTYYGYQLDSMNAESVWATGNFGQDSLAVVIDTGIFANHFMLSGSVVGGVDMSTDVGTGFEGFDLPTNHWHGTHVSGIIAGHGALGLPASHILVQSYELYTGQTLPEISPGVKLMPLLGNAPAADLYGIKVFPHTGAGAPTSLIIAALEHAIDLHVNNVHDVDLINMSLGGGTGFEGHDLESQVVDFATSVGITVVVSAGNDGPSSLTIGSPAGANTAITVGAAAHPVNTRLFWDFNFGILGIGDFLFVDDNTQMVYFSSRGPTSDGRAKPTASAVGTFVLSAFTPGPGSLGFASGTSMSSPAMAGVVALLNTESETNGLGASPFDYKEAVIAGSHMLPGFDEFEQGAGFINAADALAALQSDSDYGTAHPPIDLGYADTVVKPKGKNLGNVNSRNGVTFQVKDLAPGYVDHYYFKLHPNAEKIMVEFSNVDLGDDPIFFNSLEVHLMSAMRTTDSGYYLYSVNVWGDALLEVEPMNSTASGTVFGVNAANMPLMDGYVRLTIENDWTTFDNMSATVKVRVITGNNSAKPDESYSGVLNTGEADGFFPVGFGPNGVELDLSWKHDWRFFPAADMDMIVAWFDTDGNLFFEFGGATFASPEKVIIDANNIDAVFVLVDGFETYGLDEPWKLDVWHR